MRSRTWWAGASRTAPRAPRADLTRGFSLCPAAPPEGFGGGHGRNPATFPPSVFQAGGRWATIPSHRASSPGLHGLRGSRWDLSRPDRPGRPAASFAARTSRRNSRQGAGPHRSPRCTLEHLDPSQDHGDPRLARGALLHNYQVGGFHLVRGSPPSPFRSRAQSAATGGDASRSIDRCAGRSATRIKARSARAGRSQQHDTIGPLGSHDRPELRSPRRARLLERLEREHGLRDGFPGTHLGRGRGRR